MSEWLVDLQYLADINYHQWQEKVLLVLIFASAVLVIVETFTMLSSRLQKVTGRNKRADTFDKKEFYPVVAGVLAGFSIMSHDLRWAVFSAVAGGFIGHVGKKASKWFINKLMEEKRIGEILLLYEIISIYSHAGYSLYEALIAGSYMVSMVKKPLCKCINTWGQGPERSLKKMGEEIGIPEAKALASILQRALVIGPSKLAEYLSQESKAMENIRQYRIEQGLSVRPILQTLYLLLPGLALAGVTLLPVGYHISKAIMSVRLQY